MGVKIQDLIFREKIELSQLERKIVAVDAPNIIIGLLNFSHKSPYQEGLMTDRTQRAISHLYGLLYRVLFFYSKKMFPIFCFDGRDSDLKRIRTKDRINDFNFSRKLYEQAISSGNLSLAKQVAFDKEYFWPNINLESKALLGAMGVPYIESPASAESQCAQLVKQGIAHFSNSQDLDSLLFGCPITVQHLSKSRRRKVHGRWQWQKIQPLRINLKLNLKRLQVNQFQLIDLALLIGTDYFSGIRGIGPKTAYKLIKAHGNLEAVIRKENQKFDFSRLNSDIIQNVRKIFLFPEVIETSETFQWSSPQKSKIVELLCEEHHLNRERVSTNVDKLINTYNKCRVNFTRRRYIQKKLIYSF